MSKNLKDRLARLWARHVEVAPLPVPRNGSIITFGFDDCPRSVVETALPMLEARDWRATIYIACGLCETTNHLGLHMSLQDVVDSHERGHEIADHTFSHITAHKISVKKYLADIERNQKVLSALGIPPSENFAFPFGHVTRKIKHALRGRFTTLRGVIAPHTPDQDANLLPAVRLYSGDDLDDAIARILATKETPQWLNLFTHDVRDNPSIFGCTQDDLQRVIEAVAQSGARVMTARDAVKTLRSESEVV